MKDKINVEYIDNYLKNNYSDFELVSREYINNRQKLLIKHSCGCIFPKPWTKIKDRKLLCPKCKTSPFAFSIEKVIQIIEEKGCKYISGEYKNQNSILEYECSCGKKFIKVFAMFQETPYCENCVKRRMSERGKTHNKYTEEDVQKAIDPYGFILIKGTYKNVSTRCDCICNNGHLFKFHFNKFLHGAILQCDECRYKAMSGENHPNYKGGMSDAVIELRAIIDPWKFKVLDYYGYRCVLTGERSRNLNVHHLKPFLTIVKECCDELNITYSRYLKDYSIDDFYKLKQLVAEKHTLEIGIPIKTEIHREFHSIYGNKDNTLEQFEEYIYNKFGITPEEFKNKLIKMHTPDKRTA